MRVFRFRPQRVLDWRQQCAAQARAMVVQATSALRRLEREVRAVSRRRRQLAADINQRRRAGQRVRDWQRDWLELQAARAGELSLQLAVAAAHSVVEKRREQLTAARQAAESLSRLRQRRRAEHHRQLLVYEQQELDEWAGTQHRGRMAWSGDA